MISAKRNWARSKEGRAWAQEVKRRAGYKCQKCAATKRLCAHHITDYWQAPELRGDLTNGECLCLSCHNKEHRARDRRKHVWGFAPVPG